MTTPDTENSDELLTQTNPAETKKKNRRFAVLLYVACVFGGTLIEGWVKVFIGLSVAPMETLAFQFGVAVGPFVLGWILAKVVRLAFKKIPFNTTWGVSAVFFVVLMIMGRQGTETGVATSRVASVPQASTDVTNAKTLNFYHASCEEAFNDGQWSTAFTACSKAANQGNTKAQWSLGVMYEYGRGVVQDSKQASRWYIQAAELGDVLAQYEVGRHHQMGQGVMPDRIRALMWYMLAANGGNTYAANIRDVVAEQMTREQIAQAQQMATECTAKNFKKC